MRLSRRGLIRGAFGTVLGLPWLEALAGPRTAQRLVLMFNANGTVYPSWLPRESSGELVLSPILSPLSAHVDQLTVLGNLDMVSANSGPGDGHGKGMGHLWTGTEMWGSPIAGDVWWAGGPSVDQVIADAVGTSTALRSLELAVQPQGSRVYDRMIYRAAAQPLPPEASPRAAFDRLFTQPGTDPAQVALRRSRRKSVLDFVRDQLGAVEKTVSSSDRVRLDAHLSSVRELEHRLDAVAKPLPGCLTPEAPGTFILNTPDQFESVGHLQMDLLVYALACDLTRVASLQWSSSTSAVVFKWLGCTVDHHSLSHTPDADAGSQAQLALIDEWYAQQFAYLLDKMRKVSAGAGTLLDQSLVVWGNELGKGNVHSHTRVPFVLAGGAGGALKGNQYLDCHGRPHNDLLLSMMHLMGVHADSFGNPKYCTGPLL